jgi:acyl-CoA thioester hydrolase
MSFTLPEGFRHHTAIQVRWSDMDALGHVNNARFLTYCEQARIDYFIGLQLWTGDQNKTGLIVAKVVLDYKLPLHFGDDVHVFTRCTRLGNRSLETEQLIARLHDEKLEIAALATVIGVVYDYRHNQSTPIPDDWRTRILEYEPGQVAQ